MYHLSISVSPKVASVGENITVSGKLTYNGIPVSNIPVEVIIDGTETGIKKYTDTNGEVIFKDISFETPGKHTIRLVAYVEEKKEKISIPAPAIIASALIASAVGIYIYKRMKR